MMLKDWSALEDERWKLSDGVKQQGLFRWKVTDDPDCGKVLTAQFAAGADGMVIALRGETIRITFVLSIGEHAQFKGRLFSAPLCGVERLECIER